jgi:predicted phosphodiesterase
MTRYAVLADIHGNIWALEAVLADLEARGLGELINLGDTVYGPLEPQATVDRLRGFTVQSVRGNEDRILAEGPPWSDAPAVRLAVEGLSPEALAWLTSQPATVSLPGGILLCHGTPTSDETYLLESPSEEGGFLRDPDGLTSLLRAVREPVVLCGHSHIPRGVRLPDGRLIVNPGSVGLQAYADDLPVVHKMETGSPHARYAVLTETPAGWMVEQIALPYPWEKAAEKARRTGRDDWAAWLESGRA